MESSSSNLEERELQQMQLEERELHKNAWQNLKSSRYILEISIVLPSSLTKDHLKLNLMKDVAEEVPVKAVE
ncbi:hypothetical protein Tco_0590747 [Tanacetum coccineum]